MRHHKIFKRGDIVYCEYNKRKDILLQDLNDVHEAMAVIGLNYI